MHDAKPSGEVYLSNVNQRHGMSVPCLRDERLQCMLTMESQLFTLRITGVKPQGAAFVSALV
jgi:hypothetical protein